MKKLNNESGFSAVELILVLFVVVILSVVGWVIYKNHKTVSKTTGGSTTSSGINTAKQSNYPVVTTPTNWETYTNSQEQFGVSYPSTWVATPGSTKSQTVFRSDSNINYFGENFGPSTPSVTEPGVNITVTNQTLIQALKSDEDAAVYNNTGPGSAVTSKIISITDYMFKGHEAVQLVAEITPNQPANSDYNISQYTVNLLVAANGNVYDIGSDYIIPHTALTQDDIISLSSLTF